MFDESLFKEIKWSAEGLVPVIAQDARSGRVLMFAYMDRMALEQTAATGFAHYWSRSRARLWKKGEESGNTQRVKAIQIDCDGDVLLLQVEQAGQVACHTGRESCFFRSYEEGSWRVKEAVLRDPESMYGKGVAGA